MSLECCKDNFYVIFLMLQYLQNWDILLSQVVEPYPSNRLRKEPENPVPNRLFYLQSYKKEMDFFIQRLYNYKKIIESVESLRRNVTCL